MESVDEYLVSAQIIRDFEKLGSIARNMVVGGINKRFIFIKFKKQIQLTNQFFQYQQTKRIE